MYAIAPEAEVVIIILITIEQGNTEQGNTFTRKIIDILRGAIE
jgi:hypothetical protein